MAWDLEMNLREVKKVLAERDGYFVESDISNIENDLSKAAETKDFEIVRGDNRMFFYNSEENYFAVYWSEITGGTAFIVADVEYDVLFAELLS